MKVFEVAISMVSTILASHCFADSLDFLNEKHSILGYEKLEFYYQCTNGNQTTYAQKECSKIELELWEKVIRDIDDYVMVNGFGSDPLLSKKQYLLTQENWRTYVIISDGECDEGSVWEAAMAAPNFKLDNLYVIIDKNNFQQTGSNKEIMNVESLKEKWQSFGLIKLIILFKIIF